MCCGRVANTARSVPGRQPDSTEKDASSAMCVRLIPLVTSVLVASLASSAFFHLLIIVGHALYPARVLDGPLPAEGQDSLLYADQIGVAGRGTPQLLRRRHKRRHRFGDEEANVDLRDSTADVVEHNREDRRIAEEHS